MPQRVAVRLAVKKSRVQLSVALVRLHLSVTTLGRLFVLFIPSHPHVSKQYIQTTLFTIMVWAVKFCGWEGNREPGVALAIRYRLQLQSTGGGVQALY